MSDLISAAKAKPETLTVGVPGMGTSSHIAMEYFMQLTGTKFTVVPYRGAASVADIINGALSVSISPTIAYAEMIKDGALRPLGVTSRVRSQQIPSTPTFDEAGLSGFEATTWYVLAVPSQTPDSIVDKLNGLVAQYLKGEKGQKMLKQFDVEPEIGTPQEAKAFIAGESKKWKPIIAAAGLKL